MNTQIREIRRNRTTKHTNHTKKRTPIIPRNRSFLNSLRVRQRDATQAFYLSLIEAKNFSQLARHRTIVIVRRHDVSHVCPPSSTLVGLADCVPPFLGFDLDVPEELTRFFIEKDRVVRDAVLFQNRRELIRD